MSVVGDSNLILDWGSLLCFYLWFLPNSCTFSSILSFRLHTYFISVNLHPNPIKDVYDHAHFTRKKNEAPRIQMMCPSPPRCQELGSQVYLISRCKFYSNSALQVPCRSRTLCAVALTIIRLKSIRDVWN